MRLSEAIRLGAMLKPQAFDDSRRSVREGKSCALRAAADALGIPDFIDHGNRSLDYDAFDGRYPFLADLGACPECGVLQDVGDSIWHLNDTHQWTREKIADWVATVEPARHEAVTDASLADAVREDLTEPVISLRA